MSRHAWSDAEVATLRQRYPHERTVDIAGDMGLGVRQVYMKAASLGLKKTAEFRVGPLSACIKPGERRGRKTEFRPGVPTWNKGLNYVPGGRCAETQFKPGHKPHTWHPIGHERLTKEGYLQRKLTDTGITRRDYVAVHHLVWIAAHGPIPPGHAVAFIDGNKTRITLDNLELVSRADLMRRNTRHNLPKPLADLVALRAALNRKINALGRQDHEQHD